MDNFIEYFYNIKVEDISFNNNYYYFMYDNYLYKLYVYDGDFNIDFILELDKKLLGYTLISEVIFNKDNQVISRYNNINYILLKIYVNPNKSISLEEINYLSNFLYEEKLNINWGILWSKKIDYLENLISENGIKYPLIVNSFNYFVGMAENAISYYNNTVIDLNYKYVISHKKIRINDTVEALYNPMNIIFDYRIRDIAEYIKISFFKKNQNIRDDLINYLSINVLSLMEVRLLISRLLYPSFYFDMYEDILVDGKDENILISIIVFFRKYYDIEEILWLKKKT